MKAILMLEDGRSFSGETIAGAQGEKTGELILNTAVVGYQEMLTDPANAGKILVLTYPLIGNYGVAAKFNESKRVWVSGLIIKEKTNIFSNWQAQKSFDDFVKEHRLLVLTGIDTRSLAVHLRQKGQMLGVISTLSSNSKDLAAKINAAKSSSRDSFLDEISVQKTVKLGKKQARRKHIAVLDIGITASILRQLEKLELSVTLLPYRTSAESVLKLKPSALLISGGPEDDPGLSTAVNTVKALIGKIPLLGLGTGHQVIAQALGAKVTKMKLGHRGVNYPVSDPASYKGEITVQNHSWVVDAESLGRIKDVAVTAFNLNDRTVEGLQSKKRKILGVQYIPASPGLDEINPVFIDFLKMLERRN